MKFQGTTPAKPKAAQGELYTEEVETKVEEKTEQATDSLQ